MAMKLSELLKEKETKAKVSTESHEANPQLNPKGKADVGYRNDTSITKKQTFKEIDPSRCRPWPLHNRSKLWLNNDRCGGLVESIRRDGQQELGLVRVVRDEDDIDYEIIYGVRRWWSCSQIEGRKFKARITNADDKECARLMHLENAESKDISDFERACSFKQQLDCGVFGSKKSLAESLDVSNALVTRMYKAASIMEYDFLRQLLENYILDIPVKQASDLYELLLDEPSRKNIYNAAMLLQESDAVAAGSGASIVRDLIRSASQPTTDIEQVLLKHLGHDLVTLKRSKAGKTTLIFNKKITKIKKDGLKEQLKAVLNTVVDDLL